MLKALGFDKPKIFPLSKEEITYLDHCFRCMHEALLSDKVDGNSERRAICTAFSLN